MAADAHPGFLGAGHMARPVIQGPFAFTDPFIILMDDVIDKKDTKPVGGPHPHAGFETVTLVLEGELGDDAGKLGPGDLQLMTAGSGIEHTEVMDKPGFIRILQLWLNLPKASRKVLPAVQDLPLERVPMIEKDGTTIRLYSGSLAGVTSPVKNQVPLLLADIRLEADTTHRITIPAEFNTFLYVIDGDVEVGEDGPVVKQDQTAWLDLPGSVGDSVLTLAAGPAGARLVLYGGQPTRDEIISHGPFIADTEEDIRQLYRTYRQGGMMHIGEVPAAQRTRY